MRVHPILCLLLLPLLVGDPVARADVTGYESLADWDSLPLIQEGNTAGLASSYDRTGGNNDFNYYLSPTGLVSGNCNTVITELTGPGVITRFWMPHATANAGFTLKVTIDGVLAINTNSNDFLDGRTGYANSPLVSTALGGQVSYEPIAFQNSLKIESNNFADSLGWAASHNYYQYNYVKLAPGTVVTPYSGTLNAQQQSARTAATAILSQVGQNPAGTVAGAVVASQAGQSISPGSSIVLADLSGSGQISRLNVKMPANVSDAALDGLRLRVRYDGETNYSIDVPLSQFFGAGHGRVAYKSLPMGTDSPDGYYSYLPMPYRNGAVVELYNASIQGASIDSAKVEYAAGPVPSDAAYLHAVYAAENTVAGQLNHQLLSAKGEGRYIGNILSIQKAGDTRNILEGDDIVVVDPGTASQSTLYGTGMEDAYNGGYYYNHVVEQSNDGDIPNPTSGAGAFSGLLAMDFYDLPGFTATRADQYRWLISDAVPFTSGINVSMENYGTSANSQFASTAFYYLAPSSTWSADAGGSWEAAGNWTAGAPNGVTQTAKFLNAITAPRTVTLNADASLDTLRFDSPYKYTLSGTATLTFAGAATVNTVSGTHEIAARIAGTAGLTKIGAGTLLLSGDNTITGPITVAQGQLQVARLNEAANAQVTVAGVATLLADRIRGNKLTVNGTAAIRPGGLDANVSIFDAADPLIIAGSIGAWTGKLDLADNSLIIRAGDLAAIRDQIITAACHGASTVDWAGNGITTSMAVAGRGLGYARVDDAAGTFPMTTFKGQSVSDGDVIVMYTYLGDSNLDGVVNFSDFLRLQAGYGKPGMAWSSGDFNYDGAVNFSDFLLLQASYGKPALSDLIAPAPIPEPATLSLLTLGGLMWLKRRRV